jgi:hypothetical protein
MPQNTGDNDQYIDELQRKNKELNDLINRQKLMLEEAQAGGVNKTNCCTLF